MTALSFSCFIYSPPIFKVQHVSGSVDKIGGEVWNEMEKLKCRNMQKRAICADISQEKLAAKRANFTDG
jgi:hypothetical protein